MKKCKVLILLVGILISAFFLRLSYAEDGVANTIPWSSWYWSLNDALDPNLYDSGYAMEKYDQYAYTSGTPSKNWENLSHRCYDPPSDCWHGHCHAWSVASYMAPEPKYGFRLNGLTFYVRDLKGLLIESFYNSYKDDYDVIGADPQYPQSSPITPKEFIRILREWIGNRHQPVIIDFSPGPEVWNYPVYKYHVDFQNQGNSQYLCTGKFWYASDLPQHGVTADYVGTMEREFSFEFAINMDENGNFLDDGSWISGGPTGVIWRSETREAGNTQIDIDKVDLLLNASSFIKDIIVSQGSNTYQAHWEWKADQQQRELKIETNDIFNANPLSFEIVFGKEMDPNYSGFKVELQRPNDSTWHQVDEISWSTDIFDNDKWTGSFTIPANDKQLWSGEVKIKITTKGMESWDTILIS